MAGLKPSVNLFALLDRNDPGDKLVIDLDDAHAKQDAPAANKHKKTATLAAGLTKDLFAKAYPSARDYVIRKQQMERQARFKAKVETEAKAKAEAEAKVKANNGVSGDDKSADNSKVQDGAKRDRYHNNNYNNGASRKPQPGMPGRFGEPKRQQPNMSLNEAATAEVGEVPPAPQQAPPPPPPSLDDIDEFPSLK